MTWESQFPWQTPAAITQEIREYLTTLAPGVKPAWVTVWPQTGAREFFCFDNVTTFVEQHGGARAFGWTVWTTAAYVLYQGSTIWRAPNGYLLDVTPHTPAAANILFYESPLATYPATEFVPTSDHPAIVAYTNFARESGTEVARILGSVPVLYRQDILRPLAERNQGTAQRLEAAAARALTERAHTA